MTPKFGSSKPTKPTKPAMPAKRGAADAQADGKGLVRKAAQHKGPLKQEEGDKPVFGDINEPLDEALSAVEAQLAQTPNDIELHKRRVKVLRKMNDRAGVKAALQQAVRDCGDPFFGVKLSEVLEEEGAYSKALEWRRWVAQFYPEDPDTVRRLAATAVRAGDLETAENFYTQLIKLRADEESPLGGTFFEEMLGRGLDHNKRSYLQKMGLRLLARALINRETNAGLLESAARLAYRTKDYVEARGAFEQAIKTNPKHKNIVQWKVELLRIYAQLGLQELWKNLNASLIQELKAATRDDRTNTRAWNILANQQVQAGLFDDAIVTLKDALRADSKNAQALWELGRLYVRKGDSQSAIDYYRDIVDDATEKKSVRRAIERALAELYFKLGHYEDALQIYMRESDSNSRMIAPIFEAMGQLDESQELYIKSVEQSPRDAKCHLGLAEYWVRRENWEKAAVTAENGLRCSYATEEVHTSLAVALATAHMKMKAFDKALKTMDEICEAYPDSIHCTFRKVKLLILQDHREQALGLAEEIRVSAEHQTGCAPSSSALWSLLGDTCSLLGMVEDSRHAYSQALKYDAMDATAVRGLGILAEKHNELRLALKLYSQFVLLDPLNLATPVIEQRIKVLTKKVAALPPEEIPIIAPPTIAPPQAEPSGSLGYVGGAGHKHPFPGLPNQPNVPVVANTNGWLGDGSDYDWDDSED